MSIIDSKNVGAIILASGNSSRMGIPKWSLRMPNGDTFLQSLFQAFVNLGCSCIMVIPSSEYGPIIKAHPHLEKHLTINHHQDLGRLYSLQCGIEKLPHKHPVFLHNIDNPYLDNTVLTEMVSSLQNHDFVKIMYQNKGGHPLLLGKNILSDISKMEAQKDIVLKEVLKHYSGKHLTTHKPLVLLNINKMEDYQNFLLEVSM